MKHQKERNQGFFLREIQDQGASNPWTSPVSPAWKNYGMIRFCVDYRKLIDVTIMCHITLDTQIREYLTLLKLLPSVFRTILIKHNILICETKVFYWAFQQRLELTSGSTEKEEWNDDLLHRRRYYLVSTISENLNTWLRQKLLSRVCRTSLLKHKTDTGDGATLCQNPRCLLLAKTIIINKNRRSMCFIESSCTSQVFLVRKKEYRAAFCVDYRRLIDDEASYGRGRVFYIISKLLLSVFRTELINFFLREK